MASEKSEQLYQQMKLDMEQAVMEKDRNLNGK